MKHEAPPLRMRVDRGQLAPTSAWDQERVESYRNGSIVHVHITQEKNRKLERKYWAILGEVIKSCPVKQRDKEALHKAIRLKLGVVDAYFTFGGQLKVEVKSTSTMDDPEYQRFYEDAMALLHEETGVDPEQLSANSPDVGEDEQEPQSDAPTSEGSDGDAPRPNTPDVAADNPEPASGGPAEEEAPESSEPDKPAHGEQAASSSELSAEDREWLQQTARMLWAATGVGEQDVLKNQMAGIRDNLTPSGISQAARAKANSINAKCKLVCFGEASAADTLALIAGIAGCETKDIV